MTNYSKNNASEVLKQVEMLIDAGGRYRINYVCERLSIFDWWNEMLSQTQLKQMRSFLKEAIKLGFTGYVCFKVGASGCSNGMWAHYNESTDGYSPDGDCIFRSFTPDYTNWDFCKDGKWYGEEHEDELTTMKQFENAFYGE